MSRLHEWLASIEAQGYNGANARARLCQDIVLEAISKGKLSRHVTIKGGVVMRSFIDDINIFDDIHIEISGAIEPLKHQDYHGKCLTIHIYDDEGMTIDSKIDLGVHKDLSIQQEEYCFDVCMDEEGASLLINSREQMLTEKLRSLLKFGPLSTRFKDIFDICYLVDHVNRKTLNACINHYIFSDKIMRENNYPSIIKRLQETFDNRRYQSRIKTSRKNWLGIREQDAFQKIIRFFQDIANNA